MIFFLVLFFSQELRPHLSDPQPLAAAGATVENDSVYYRGSGWTCRIKPVSSLELYRELGRNGVDAVVLERQDIKSLLLTALVFLVELQNSGPEDLAWNQDRTQLLASKIPVGMQLRMMDFWPPGHSGQNPALERLARLFSKTTLTVPAGTSRKGLVVFRPLGKRFPKRVHIRLDHLFYGYQSHTLECRFDVRYPKP